MFVSTTLLVILKHLFRLSPKVNNKDYTFHKRCILFHNHCISLQLRRWWHLISFCENNFGTNKYFRKRILEYSWLFWCWQNDGKSWQISSVNYWEKRWHHTNWKIMIDTQNKKWVSSFKFLVMELDSKLNFNIYRSKLWC